MGLALGRLWPLAVGKRRERSPSVNQASSEWQLGDTVYDVEAARRAGVGTVAVRSGGWRDGDLEGALAIYDDVADLLEHYDESPFVRGVG